MRKREHHKSVSSVPHIFKRKISSTYTMKIRGFSDAKPVLYKNKLAKSIARKQNNPTIIEIEETDNVVIEDDDDEN